MPRGKTIHSTSRSAVRKTGERLPMACRPLSPKLQRTLALVVRKDKTLPRGLQETIKALHSLS
jgi:hypothetical protein